jgi:DNA-directed RNA polymerase subunit N (RpoN/RPB10)
MPKYFNCCGVCGSCKPEEVATRVATIEEVEPILEELMEKHELELDILKDGDTVKTNPTKEQIEAGQKLAESLTEITAKIKANEEFNKKLAELGVSATVKGI